MTVQLPQDESDTLAMIQNRRPDSFFNETQQQRLAQLMAAWRLAQQSGAPWPEEEQAELAGLVEAELRASAARAAALAGSLFGQR